MELSEGVIERYGRGTVTELSDLLYRVVCDTLYPDGSHVTVCVAESKWSGAILIDDEAGSVYRATQVGRRVYETVDKAASAYGCQSKKGSIWIEIAPSDIPSKLHHSISLVATASALALRLLQGLQQ